MFFIMGITDEQKELLHEQMVICARCGRYGRYIVYMTYTVLSLFFIPCFKWNRQYYVRMSCCNTTYRLDPEIGKQIARGEKVEIRPEHLTPSGGGWQQWNQQQYEQQQWNREQSDQQQDDHQRWNRGQSDQQQCDQQQSNQEKHCMNCGFSTTEDYEFCPKCGRKF